MVIETLPEELIIKIADKGLLTQFMKIVLSKKMNVELKLKAGVPSGSINMKRKLNLP